MAEPDYAALRRLPDGLTCADCQNGKVCDRLFGAVRRQFTSCDFYPSRFKQGERPMAEVDSTSDERTINNVMRHAYRVLTDAEKAAMQKIKDDGLAFHDFIGTLGASRELSVAKTKIEEAVMWAVKHITA